MRRYLLDTDHVSLQQRGHERVLARVASAAPDSLAISIVTVEEMLRGRLALLARRSDGEQRVWAYTKLMETVRFTNRIHVVQFDLTCERRLAELRAMGLRVGSQDLRIASTALVHGLTVVTRNRRDFGRVPGLLVEDWSA